MWNHPLPQGPLERQIQTKRRFRKQCYKLRHDKDEHHMHTCAHTLFSSWRQHNQRIRLLKLESSSLGSWILTIFMCVWGLVFSFFACICFHFYQQVHRYNNEKRKPNTTNILKYQSKQHDKQSIKQINRNKNPSNKSIKKRRIFLWIFLIDFLYCFDWFFNLFVLRGLCFSWLHPCVCG